MAIDILGWPGVILVTAMLFREKKEEFIGNPRIMDDY